MMKKFKTQKLGKVGSVAAPVKISSLPSAIRHHRGTFVQQVPFSEHHVAQEVQAYGFEGPDRRAGERRATAIAGSVVGVGVPAVQRLSDPLNAAVVTVLIGGLDNNKEEALRFLQSIGVASAHGRLTERFGG